MAQFATVTGHVGSKGQSSKSKTVAAILGIFDAFGLYHFYIGKAGIGIGRLLFSLLLFIGFLAPIVGIVNIIFAIVIPILVLTSKPCSKWHQDAQGFELQD
ncbi:hypothetical protein [Streptococcus pluranimalium]|uniref:hypothetical protein n=1 Tax=Streptococcus pluranimalium TaxID=82348 RepID=UPI003F68EB21